MLEYSQCLVRNTYLELDRHESRFIGSPTFRRKNNFRNQHVVYEKPHKRFFELNQLL